VLFGAIEFHPNQSPRGGMYQCEITAVGRKASIIRIETRNL